LTELEQKLVPRMCGKAEGSRAVILHLLRLILLIVLLVWQRMLLRG